MGGLFEKLGLKKGEKGSFAAAFKTRRFQAGGYSVLISMIVLTIAVVINLVVGQLPSAWTKLDTTSNELYSISQQTREIVSGLSEDVTIYVLAQSGGEDRPIMELLGRYADLSDHVRIVQKDPVIYPTFIQSYTSEDPYLNSLVVESGKRFRVINYTDIYEETYNMDYSTSVSFDGEGEVTSAIDYVTTDSLPVLYIIGGHGEYQLPDALKATIEKENMSIQELNLLNVETIPEDAACVLLTAPEKDISAGEREMLTSYLKGGGRMLYLSEYIPAEAPNLTQLMAEFGVAAVDGIIMEGDTSHSIQGYPHYLLPDYGSHEIIAPLKENGFYVVLPIGHGIETVAGARSSLAINYFLMTSDLAYSKVAAYEIETTEREDGDIGGPLNLAAAITEPTADGETRIVWIGSAMVIDEQADALVYGSNTDLIVNALGWMTERESSVTIRPKAITSDYLTIPTSVGNAWALTMVVIIPVALLLAGGVVWYRRKNR